MSRRCAGIHTGGKKNTCKRGGRNGRMMFRVLGPLEIAGDRHDLTPGAPKQRAVLALLILRCNRTVQTASLIDELWGECPPESALPTLQTYIYKLRKML